MKPVILFRRGNWTEEAEFEAARQYFDVVEYRSQVPPNSLVIPRYSALPFYGELVKDVEHVGSKLINSLEQHQYVADVTQYVADLGELTPRTWIEWGNLPEGSYVVKGRTNSRKHEWNKRMFAETRADVPKVARALLDDDLIRDQGLVVREYVPLRTFDYGINGLPITNEWRFFCLNGEIVDAGYYWASMPECEWAGHERMGEPGEAPPPPEAKELVREVLRRIDPVPFVVVDVAEKAAGGWIVIELNDGQMSGLSMIPPERFYRNLRRCLK